MPAHNARGLAESLDALDFSGVVLLRQEGETCLALARGLASQRWHAPNNLNTRFDCASITKLFTAVAVLQLAAAGKLDIDASIHDQVDLAGTTIDKAISLRHLLTHTSGMADDADEEAGEDYARLFDDRPCYAITETSDFLPLFAHKPPLAVPGTRCRYCNVGYILAGLAIERVTGVPYRRYVAREVFGRAEMLGAGFFDRRGSEPDVAEGWDQLADGQWQSNIFSYPPIGSPDGGAHVTATDLMRFLDALRGNRLLPPDLTQAFLTPQVRHPSGVWFGLGLEFDDAGFGKEGTNAGVSAKLRHYRATGMDAVVLSNSASGAWPVVAELDRRFKQLQPTSDRGQFRTKRQINPARARARFP